MKRTLLFALTIALAACGDDDAPSDDSPKGEKDAAVTAKEDATIRDAARDGASSELLDASMEPDNKPDASAPADASVVDATSFDAGTDAGNDASSDARTACVAEGEDCQQGACCDGTACVTSSEKPYPACLATCTEASDCESGCCTALSGSAKVCADESYCEEEDNPLAPLKESCFGIPNVYSSTDKYMGKATYHSYETDSVCKFGAPYGKSSSDGPLSITSGAYSSSSFGAPEIRCDENDFYPIAIISRATSAPNNVRIIDPDDLCQVLENSNL